MTDLCRHIRFGVINDILIVSSNKPIPNKKLDFFRLSCKVLALTYG